MQNCQTSGVGPFPNNNNRRTVISLTSLTVYSVEIRAAGKKFICDEYCQRYKQCAICAHTIAVAYKIGKLHDFVSSYKAPIKQIMKENVPTGSGKKDNQKSMKRKRKGINATGQLIHTRTVEIQNQRARELF